MRKIVVLSFISLDGVMQAPGTPEEDASNGFSHGGWSVSYWDSFLENVMAEQMDHPFDMLLGRNTYDVFAESWPKMDPDNVINKYKKYVVTKRPVPEDSEIWKNSVAINNNVPLEIKKIKEENGPEIQVHGSCELVQTLLKNDLVDELKLKIYPLTLGTGKRLFMDGTIPAGFKLTKASSSPGGVIVADYERYGEIKYGSFV